MRLRGNHAQFHFVPDSVLPEDVIDYHRCLIGCWWTLERQATDENIHCSAAESMQNVSNLSTATFVVEILGIFREPQRGRWRIICAQRDYQAIIPNRLFADTHLLSRGIDRSYFAL